MVRYKMVGRDVNSAPTQFRTWITNNAPDLDGYYYTGLKSGPLPMVDIHAYQIPDGYIMDFNLSIPTSWDTTLCSLPTVIANSHLAVIDGYVYLFGGEVSDVIYRAPLGSPCSFVDDGYRLPSTLCGAQFLDPNDGYVYLIGGRSFQALDTIYRASKSNPLIWTNMGSHLPKPLEKSQLVVVDGYAYLFGGKDLNYASNNIWKASLSNPLSWTDTGATIPDKLYGSTLSIMDGYICLFGGLFKEDSPTANIYTAPTSTPTVWSNTGTLPFAAMYGQYITFGTKGYLFTPGSYIGAQPYETRILSANMSNPNTWTDTQITLPKVGISQSQIAIIYDRIFLYGGSGSSVILTTDQILKYDPNDPNAVAYAALARTQVQATVNPTDLFKVLGFPPWKCNYS